MGQIKFRENIAYGRFRFKGIPRYEKSCFQTKTGLECWDYLVGVSYEAEFKACSSDCSVDLFRYYGAEFRSKMFDMDYVGDLLDENVFVTNVSMDMDDKGAVLSATVVLRRGVFNDKNSFCYGRVFPSKRRCSNVF